MFTSLKKSPNIKNYSEFAKLKVHVNISQVDGTALGDSFPPTH